jgi:hypothetical protein
MLGQCFECGDKSLVLFLSRAVPALGIISGSAFFYWGGMFALPRRIVDLLRWQRSCYATWHHSGVGVLQLRQAAIAHHGPVPGFGRSVRVPASHGNLAFHLLLGLGRSSLLARARTQLQVLATLGSMSGIAYPARIQTTIGVAKLSNLDLVRSCATNNV